MVRGFPEQCPSRFPLVSRVLAWCPVRCCAEYGLVVLEESECGESCTVTQLMTFFLCLEMVLRGLKGASEAMTPHWLGRRGHARAREGLEGDSQSQHICKGGTREPEVWVGDGGDEQLE